MLSVGFGFCLVRGDLGRKFSLRRKHEGSEGTERTGKGVDGEACLVSSTAGERSDALLNGGRGRVDHGLEGGGVVLGRHCASC